MFFQKRDLHAKEDALYSRARVWRIVRPAQFFTRRGIGTALLAKGTVQSDLFDPRGLDRANDGADFER